MKKKFIKLLSVAMCVMLILGMAACSSEKDKKDDKSTAVDFGTTKMEFKYSLDRSNWSEVKTGTEMFREGGKYSAGDVEVIYLHMKNHSDFGVYYQISLKNASDNDGGAVFGFVENVSAAFSSADEAKKALGDNAKALNSGYINTSVMGSNSAKTIALVICATNDAELKLSLTFNSGYGFAEGYDNSSSIQNGATLTNANTYGIVDDATVDTTVTNSDNSFVAVIPKNTMAQGTFFPVSLEASCTIEKQLDYTVKFAEGVQYTNAIELSVLVGYGLEGVEVTFDGTKVESTYNKYSGSVKFSVVPKNAVIKVSYSGVTEINGVLVQGNETVYTTYNDALDSARDNQTFEILTFVVFGRVNYTVTTGQKIYFTGENSQVKTINIIGGNETAEIFITEDSGSVPSLPYAGNGLQINYLNMSFDSGNELQVDGEFSRHFDYRGEADISFKNCTFKKALATRGPNSSVVVDNCNFTCPAYEDTFKGYCYYSVQKIGGGDITVGITNNDFSGCWGGINLDWDEGDFTVKNNKFGGYNCSKPAIQFSHANVMIVENNEFSNITDENAFRFYKNYNGQQTHIINNTFNEVAYLFQSDVPYAMLEFKDFKFEGNTITGTTDLTLGHEANATADKVSPHGYTVDKELNTIK